MFLLDESMYHKVLKPLGEVTLNKLFARSVVEKHVSGKIYVDNTENPSTFYVLHPYGMALLFGNNENTGFNQGFVAYAGNIHKERNRQEWLQAFPPVNWDSIIRSLLGNIEINTRVNFKFNALKYPVRKDTIMPPYQIQRTGKELFEKMNGSVIPRYFWESADHFFNMGVGFSAIYNSEPVSTAYSAFIHDRQLELGIETVESHRGKGLAFYTCCALIDYCLQNDYEPVWACKLENNASCNLAKKLGFEPVITIPYYLLPV